MWKDVFQAAFIARQDNFFDLGGDSLRAMVVAAKVHARLAVELDLRMFADSPTLSALAATIEALRRVEGRGQLPPLTRVSRAVPLPLSYNQERTWNFARTLAASAGYTVACSYRLRGPVDVEALRESMNYIIRRHEILRTTFAEVNGRPVQIIHPSASAPLHLLDLTDALDAEEQATRYFRSQARQAFDLSRLPLMH